jgi:hypothetical protein
MQLPRAPLAVLVCALVLAAPASARTLHGTVVAPPVAREDGGATLPVLLTARSARRAGHPVVGVVVAGKRPVRWGTDRLGLASLRPGDRLTLRVRRARARRVVLRVSGRGDAFGRVVRQFRRIAQTSRQTIALAQAIAPARSATVPLDQVRALRRRLTLLGSDLQALGDDVARSLQRLTEAQPHDPARRAAVAAVQAAYATTLTTLRDHARAAAQRTEQAAATLNAIPEVANDHDGTQTPTEGPLPISLPVESTSAVSGATDGLLRMLNAMGLVGDQPLAVPGYQLGPPGAGTSSAPPPELTDSR